MSRIWWWAAPRQEPSKKLHSNKLRPPADWSEFVADLFQTFHTKWSRTEEQCPLMSKKCWKKLFVINYKLGFRFFKGLIQIYIVGGFQLMSKVLFTVLLYSKFQLKTHQIVNPKLFPPDWDSASWRKFIGEESFKKGDSIFLKILLVQMNSDNWKKYFANQLKKNFKFVFNGNN